MGQEAKPAPTVTLHPRRKFTIRLSLTFSGREGLTLSKIPKQRPLQMTIPMQEITKPLQSPAIPSLAKVFLYTSTKPLNCFSPPFLEFFKSLLSLVRAQSKEYTKKRETEPAAPPEAKLPKNQIQYPSLFLSLPNILLKQSLKAKLRAWVGKYLRTLVPFPFQRALTPSSEATLLAQFPIPVQGVVNDPDFSIASMFWSLSLMSSIGAAMVFEMAAETPPIKNSIAKVEKSFFFFPSPMLIQKKIIQYTIELKVLKKYCNNFKNIQLLSISLYLHLLRLLIFFHNIFARDIQFWRMAARMTKRLQKQFEAIQKNPELKASLPTDDLKLWHVEFQGAKNTLYDGEFFKLQLRFNNDYPIESPEVLFIGSVPLHEHIYSNGFICLSILYDEWSPALTVNSIVLSILSMLSSATKKVKPFNDAEFVKRAAGRGPKAFLWSYDDDKA